VQNYIIELENKYLLIGPNLIEKYLLLQNEISET